jgi:hypothetical protein
VRGLLIAMFVSVALWALLGMIGYAVYLAVSS